MSILKIDVPRAFRPLLEPARYKGAYGGRGGAKSHFFAEQLIVKAYAKPVRWLCTRQVQNSIKESVRQLLIDKIVKNNLESYFNVLDNEIRGIKNDSLILFKGMQHYNAESIKSLEGYDGAWIEEAQSFSSTSLRLLRPTIRKELSELWFSWNPRHKTDAVDAFFRSGAPPKDSICVKVGWQDNPWFPEVLRKEMEHDYEHDPIMANHVWGGDYLTISEGSYYGALLIAAENEKRIGRVPWEPKIPVHTAWDLGIGDATAIWFCQQHGPEIRLIDFYENSGVALDHYVKMLRERPYVYGEHILPHDVMVSDLSTGKTRYQTLASLGINARALQRDSSVDDGINATRMMLPRCWFDKEKCERGLEALRHYRKEYDEKLQTFKARPVHDWSSHAADAFRYLARGLPDQSYAPHKRQRYSGNGSNNTSWMSL